MFSLVLTSLELWYTKALFDLGPPCYLSDWLVFFFSPCGTARVAVMRFSSVEIFKVLARGIPSSISSSSFS